jgi:hypothetical protein
MFRLIRSSDLQTKRVLSRGCQDPESGAQRAAKAQQIQEQQAEL